jgi:ABC-type polysaccharide/polyol phosphate export permease
VLDLNPLATIIEAYRALLLGAPGPSAALVAVLVAVSAVLAVAGFAVFRALQPSFADHL